MKKNILLLLTICFTGILFSQNSIEKTKELFKIVKCDQIVENVFNGIKLSLINDTELLFKNEGLDYKNTEDVKRYQDFLNESIPLYSKTYYVELIRKYSTKYSKEQVLKFINLTKKEGYEKTILEESGIKEELTKLIIDSNKELMNDIKLIVTEIRAKYNTLKLVLYINNKITRNQNIDLELFLNLNSKNRPKVLIFDKNTYQIKLPENFNYDEIETLTISYLGKDYVFNKYNKVMPKEIQELTSPLSNYCFEKLEKWTLRISDERIELETRVITGQIR